MRLLNCYWACLLQVLAELKGFKKVEGITGLLAMQQEQIIIFVEQSLVSTT